MPRTVHIISYCNWFTLFGIALLSHSGLANTLLEVRIGPHKNFDRIVFEFESEATCYIETGSDQTVVVHFNGISASPTFSLPPLPHGLFAMKAIRAFRVGDNSLVFEIPLKKEAIFSKLTLPGRPWRLAIDLASKITQTESAPEQESKPDYIPGDRPIPTKMAEEDKAPQYIPGDQPISTKYAGISIFLSDSLDPVKVRAVLTYFYLAVGDSARANIEAAHYQQLTGSALDLSPDFDLSVKTPTQPKIMDIPTPPIQQVPLLLYISFAFVAGLLGGAFGVKTLPRIHIRLPKVKVTKVPKTPLDQAEELEEDLRILHEVAAQEPTREKVVSTTAAKLDLPVSAENAHFDETGTGGEDEIKESLMDRRVRRVLELSKQGHNIQSIAQELEMGQDEVKLILDLNQ